MAAPAKRISKNASKKATPDAAVSRQELEDQVQAFIKSGGEITQVPNGKSGQQDSPPGRKHIIISKK